jgi:hypothetical protein
VDLEWRNLVGKLTRISSQAALAPPHGAKANGAEGPAPFGSR